MAYNGFPVNYQPAQIYYPQQAQQQYMPQQAQPQPQQPMTPPTIHAEIIQVDSEQTAENYPLAAGSSQMMIAKDDSAIYVKTMYANGQYNLDAFIKRPKAPNKPQIDMDMYVTREEFETRLKSLTAPQKGKAKKEEVKDDVSV